MSEFLEALVDGRRVGRLTDDPRKDRVGFQYDKGWAEDPAAFPLSLAMPLSRSDYPDAIVRPFITGLLPDNDEVLRRWGKLYQVSARNPFRLLSHVGEECAGAVQFVRPDRAAVWLGGEPPHGIGWLSEDELAERMRDLVANHAAARRLGDRGQFSLAGAQAKIGLLREDGTGRWGLPEGETPTTHILKPNTGGFGDYDQNEPFCLQLAGRIGLPTVSSWVEQIGGVQTIVVRRYDRVSVEGKIVRVHQEDACQALATMPGAKYQKDGGPSARDLFALIRDYSGKPREDELRFLDALIFNWLIMGTDAHAKNYSFLLGAGGQVRLAPLYDLSSGLPYPREIPPKKAKLAMKIGGEYKQDRIGARQWEKAAGEWKLDRDLVGERIVAMARKLPEAAERVRGEIAGVGEAEEEMLGRLVDGIAESCDGALGMFAGE